MRFIFIFSFIALLFLTPCTSDAAGKFFVSGIRVNKSAASGEEARDKAVADAEKKAFKTLMLRLNPEKGAAIAKKTPSSRISAMVMEMQIYNERVTGTFYKADFSFKFHPGTAIAASKGVGHQPKKHLSVYRGHQQLRPGSLEQNSHVHHKDRKLNKRSAHSVYSTSQHAEGAAMLLPVLEEGGAARQWERDTPWMRTWRGMSEDGSIYTVPQKTAPILHPSMLEYIRSINLTEEDRLRIVRFLQPYGPSHTSFMIYGTYRYDHNRQSALIDATLYEIAPKFRAIFQHTVNMNIGEAYDVFIHRTGQELLAKSQPYLGTKNVRSAASTVHTPFANTRPDRSEPSHLDTCRATAHTEPFLERMIISAHSLPQWLTIKKKIEQVSGIAGVSSVSMTPGRMIVDLAHHCTSGKALAASMASVGLSYDPGESVIFMPDTAR